MTTKTILLSLAMTLGAAACYQDPPANSPASNQGERPNTGVYNHSLNSSPATADATNVNAGTDMTRTGNQGTTKEGNPGTAYPSHR